MSDLLSNEHVFTDITNELFAQGLVAKKELDNITSVKSLSKNEKGSAMAHLFHDKIRDSDNPRGNVSWQFVRHWRMIAFRTKKQRKLLGT